MKKFLLFSIMIFVFTCNLYPQELTVKTFNLDKMNTYAQTSPVYLRDQKTKCPLVLVDVVDTNVVFEGDIMKVDYKNNCYWVYMIPDATYIIVSTKDNGNLRYDFIDEEGDKLRLESGKTYILSISKSTNEANVTFGSMPGGARVFLNGQEIGVTPFAKKIKYGHYTGYMLREKEKSSFEINVKSETMPIYCDLRKSVNVTFNCNPSNSIISYYDVIRVC